MTKSSDIIFEILSNIFSILFVTLWIIIIFSLSKSDFDNKFSKNISELSCEIIAGAANNQLEKEGIHDIALKKKNILYAPDFLINAGGLINVYSELKNWKQEKALKKTENIYDTTISILIRSEKDGTSTHNAALSIAQERLDKN